MSSQRPSTVDLLVSSEVSRVSGGDERRPVAQAVKFAEIDGMEKVLLVVKVM